MTRGVGARLQHHLNTKLFVFKIFEGRRKKKHEKLENEFCLQFESAGVVAVATYRRVYNLALLLIFQYFPLFAVAYDSQHLLINKCAE